MYKNSWILLGKELNTCWKKIEGDKGIDYPRYCTCTPLYLLLLLSLSHFPDIYIYISIPDFLSVSLNPCSLSLLQSHVLDSLFSLSLSLMFSISLFFFLSPDFSLSLSLTIYHILTSLPVLLFLQTINNEEDDFVFIDWTNTINCN